MATIRPDGWLADVVAFGIRQGTSVATVEAFANVPYRALDETRELMHSKQPSWSWPEEN